MVFFVFFFFWRFFFFLFEEIFFLFEEKFNLDTYTRFRQSVLVD